MESLAVIILAAGLGKRMGLGRPKVLVEAGGRPLISHVLRTAAELRSGRLIVVSGYGAIELKNCIAADPLLAADLKESVRFATQGEQLGTGHAVLCALPQLEGFKGTVLVLCGDVPLVRVDTLRSLVDQHTRENAAVSLVSFSAPLPNSYGRIVRNESGMLAEIIEARDCGPQQGSIREFNSGIYAVESSFLAAAVGALSNDNAQKEYYLTDIVRLAAVEGRKTSVMFCTNAGEFQGVNNFCELAMVNSALRENKVRALLEQGVRIEDPQTCYVDPEAEVAAGAELGPNVQILGPSRIGAGVRFEGTAWISNCRIEQGALIRFGVRAENAVIGARASVGPFAHLRPGTVLEEEVRVGNFVETKNSHLHAGAKASHLTYLGDASVGARSNIGAGTITCNYDGSTKNRTTLGAGVFIGSNSCLVAPLTIGEGAYIGAGSVITKDVDKDALALTRPELVVKKDWARRKREKKER